MRPRLLAAFTLVAVMLAGAQGCHHKKGGGYFRSPVTAVRVR
jgi:hypothetical protein